MDIRGKTVKEAVFIDVPEFLDVIDKMKPEFGSDIFANPKDESFNSSVRQIYQTFGGEDCYPSLEEKAAMLLYLIVKSHSFSDGNKRIGANCFLYFMQKNGMLHKNGESMFPVADLIPYARNSRTHNEEQIAQIMASIKEFGFTNPILIGGDNVIIAGHGRLLAAQRLGLKEVPVIRLPDLTETQRKARLMELDPKFCDVIVKRWDEYTGKKAQLVENEGNNLEIMSN